MARWREFSFYPPPSTPRAAKGGIKAQSQRGGFGSSWWARRWIQVLESFGLTGRLQRGRRYARTGQVLDIAIAAGQVSASVQGSQPRPYSVIVKARPLGPDALKKLAAALRREPVHAAKLLAGQMPEDIETVFAAAGQSLFPQRLSELTTDCSCPDWGDPCKHLAAVYYLLGEEFDRDPFLIFRLRGLDRQGLIALLGHPRKPEKLQAAQPVPLAEPLPTDLQAFWQGGELPDLGEATIPAVGAALLRKLGAFPFWRGSQPLQQALEPVYAAASTRGRDAFLAGSGLADGL